MVGGFRAVPPRVICHDYRYLGDYRCDRNLDLSFILLLSEKEEIRWRYSWWLFMNQR